MLNLLRSAEKYNFYGFSTFLTFIFSFSFARIGVTASIVGLDALGWQKQKQEEEEEEEGKKCKHWEALVLN